MTIRMFADRATMNANGDWPPVRQAFGRDGGKKDPYIGLDLLQDGTTLSCRFMAASPSSPAWAALAVALERAAAEVRNRPPGEPCSVSIEIAIPSDTAGGTRA
jgi:hypothetical protein